MSFFKKLFTKSQAAPFDSHGLLQALGVGYETDTNITVTPESAMRCCTVFSCIRVLAESVGQLPLNYFVQQGEKRVKATGNRLYHLLKLSPNSYMTSQELWELCITHLCLRGNFYAYKNTVKGELRELLPLNPDNVEPKLLDDYTLVYDVTFANGSRDILTADQVFHVKGFSVDGIKGVSPISYARNAIGLGLATEKHGAKLFSNGARPGGILSTDQTLNDDVVKRVKQSWDDQYQGLDNAHKVAILEAGLKWVSVGMTSDDAQFLETRKYQRSEICGLFRVPPHMVGDLEKATFSNIEHQAQEFVVNALVPYLTRIEQRIQVSLIPEAKRASHFAKFNVNSLLRGDMKSRAEFYTKLQQTGSLSPNEIRALEDLDPRDGGDIYLTPMNMLINGKEPEKNETN
ncbi:phage portal protein [Spartinivicinus marinus]|uniref:phage portal protein n=1 Tax=Spartinivicinus marinus TaxID=2994442 RepID=UPI00224F317D|nr:phage portal protein [Spartinivicinus marinus]MCX4025114.1 phage portal protein [Spartinivicinus marinus]MCX4026957.1 phage portal protein [Spartinivicinus marinus]